jgi:hypothetical protein
LAWILLPDFPAALVYHNDHFLLHFCFPFWEPPPPETPSSAFHQLITPVSLDGFILNPAQNHLHAAMLPMPTILHYITFKITIGLVIDQY